MKKAIFKKALSLLLVVLTVIVAVPSAKTDVSAASFTMLKQTDSAWANSSYNGGKLSETGSGIFALANAIGFVNGKTLSVTDVASWASEKGTYNANKTDGVDKSTFFYNAGKQYGSTLSFSVNCGSDNKGFFSDSTSSTLTSHLAKGYTAVAHVKDHFIALVGYDFNSNSFRVWDSAPSSLRGTTGGDVWINASVLFSSPYMCVDWFCLISETTSDSIPVKAAFDPMVYRYRNQDIAGIDKMTTAELKAHWLSTGIDEGRPSSFVLDIKYYKANSQDLSSHTYRGAYNHFIDNGYKESRKFSPTFIAWEYCDNNEDVVASFGNNFLQHFLNYGIREDRKTTSTFNPNYYWHIRPDVEKVWPGNYEMNRLYYAAIGINDNVKAYDDEMPQITDIVISNLTSSGYTVSCKVTDNWGVTKVSFPVWTISGGQDDLAPNFLNTQLGTRNGDIFSFRVNASDHNNETGTYATHIYAYDIAGNRVSTTAPNITVKGSSAQKLTLSSTSSYITKGYFVQNVKLGTTANALLSEFTNSETYAYDKDGNLLDGKGLAGTGTSIRLYNGDTLLDEMTAIVAGDLTGDGKLTTTDFLVIKSAFLELYVLDSAQIIAADLDESGQISATDYLKAKDALLYGVKDKTEASKPSLEFNPALQITDSDEDASVVNTSSNLVYVASGHSSHTDNTFNINSNFTMKFDNQFIEKFNRLTLCYVSSEPLKCIVSYRVGGETVNDLFYLEAGNQTFCGLIQGYLKGNKATELLSVTVSTCEAVDASFALCEVRTEMMPVYNDEVYYIEDNDYKLGVRLTWGGGICYLYDKNHRSEGLTNLINQHDTGRLVQQSYYGTYNNDDPNYTDGYFNNAVWGYNPVQGGDKGNTPSRIVDIVVGEKSVYVKAQPMDWGHVGSITPSYMENVYILEDGLIRVDNRFVDFSGYKHIYRHQELPAFYTVSYLNRFSYYAGSKSWTDDKITNLDDLPFWGSSSAQNQCYLPLKNSNTETWCAWTNSSSGYGIGLYTPCIDMFLAGRSSYNGTKDPNEGPTNYVAPLNEMILVSYEPIEYSYLMVTGSLSEIRETFKENKDFVTNESLHYNHKSLRIPD